MKFEKKRRSLPKKIGAWLSRFFKLYRLGDEADYSVRLAAETARRVGDLDDRLQRFEKLVDERVGGIERRGSDRHAALEHSLDDRSSALEQSFDNRSSALEQSWRAQFADAERSVSERLAELGHETARALEKRSREQDNLGRELEQTLRRVDALRREIMFQQRRVTQLALPASAEERVRAAARVVDERLDSFYVAFTDVFRGEREDIKNRLAVYLEAVTDAGAGQLGKPALDVGCGRGEWLELLRERHIPAYGVDSNGAMVERTAALGLDARCVDALDHLRSLPDAALSALTAFHVVEHLPLDTLIDLFDEGLRALAPGGVLILETPNPETMKVGATTFYNDPTHRNPIPPQVLKFIVEHRGFQAAEILRLHPFTEGLLREPTADAELLNRDLFGSQDYAVIARRL